MSKLCGMYIVLISLAVYLGLLVIVHNTYLVTALTSLFFAIILFVYYFAFLIGEDD